MTGYTITDTPVGPMVLTADNGALTGLQLPDGGHHRPVDAQWERVDDDPVLKAAATQLEEYFAGRRTSFDVPLDLQGTAFQRAVWDALRDIAYGTTASYGEIAAQVGQPGAARAVGMANHRNPVAVIVPCHRVIGADGSLTGYGGGLSCKEFLLSLEGAWPAPLAVAAG
jgi:methylated-DNA-[protein]-cysteine S-methyltransferase